MIGQLKQLLTDRRQLVVIGLEAYHQPSHAASANRLQQGLLELNFSAEQLMQATQTGWFTAFAGEAQRQGFACVRTGLGI